MQCQPRLTGPTYGCGNSAVAILKFLILFEQRACVFISQITQPVLITKLRNVVPVFLVDTNEETRIQCQKWLAVSFK